MPSIVSAPTAVVADVQDRRALSAEVATLDRRDRPLSPPPTDEAFARIVALDRLRGGALIGSFVVNLAVFSVDSGAPAGANGFERVIFALRGSFTDGKWYTVFAFVFGYSLSLQLRGKSPLAHRRRRVMRRLFALAVLGVAHGLLLYRWDVLFAYGLIGALVYVMRRFRTRTLVGIALCAISLGTWLATEESISPERLGFGRIFGNEAVAIYSGSSLRQVLWLHVHNHLYNVAAEVLLQWPFVLAMMLFGLLAERHLLIAPRPLQTRLHNGLLLVGALSLAWNIGSDLSDFDRYSRITTVVGMFAIVGQAVGAIVLISARTSSERSLIVSLGRMSLTNYLVQSVVSTTLLFGYGFGLGPRFNLWVQAAFAAAFLFVQAWFSRAWLRARQRGPIEDLVARWANWSPTAT